MAAAAGASGTRAFLQAHGPRWMTPLRLKRATIGLCAAALAVSTVGFSGSSQAHGAAAGPAAAHHADR
jgi:hypothetical protein